MPRIIGGAAAPRRRRRARRISAPCFAGSAIRESHRGCGRVQDNYALRCMPQVHGAARDAFAHAREVLEREMNSATDNPLVFAGGAATILSGGNFHGAPVGLVLDYAAVAATDLASISERRIEKLVNPALSDLPAFLVREGGAPLGPDDGAGHGGRPRLGVQDPGAPGVRRLDPDLRRQGGPRLDVADRRAQARGDRRRTSSGSSRSS